LATTSVSDSGYRIEAFATLLVTSVAVAAVVFLYGIEPLLFVYDHWTGLVTASLAMSILQVPRVFD
jgi:delta14-sterol reductase